jgi:hypothetical protein
VTICIGFIAVSGSEGSLEAHRPAGSTDLSFLARTFEPSSRITRPW